MTPFSSPSAGWAAPGGCRAGSTSHGRRRSDWDGVIEEEGNLGRTDLLVGAALVRHVGQAGALTLHVKVPLLTRAHGAQVDYPVIVALGWSR